MRLPLRIAGLLLAALVVAIWAGWDLPRRTLLPTPADGAAEAAADRAARPLARQPPAGRERRRLGENVTATHCFRLRQSGRYGSFAVRGQRCAGGAAYTPPPAPPDPEDGRNPATAARRG